MLELFSKVTALFFSGQCNSSRVIRLREATMDSLCRIINAIVRSKFSLTVIRPFSYNISRSVPVFRSSVSSMSIVAHSTDMSLIKSATSSVKGP